MNLTIVLPTFNEAQNLQPMVRALLALPVRERVSILIVDDNSPDGTGRIADELAQQHPGTVQVLHRERKEGLGRAYIAGITKALEDGADLILQMDCDFSHRLEDIPAMLAAIDDGDLVIGSRFCRGGSVDRHWGASRKLLSRFANGFYVRAALGLPIHDATGGFRLWRRDTLLAIDPARRVTLNGYGFQVEMAYLAHRLGARIKEVPIHFPDRSRGQSKMSMRIMMEAALRVPSLRWRHRDRPAEPLSAPPVGWFPTLRRRLIWPFGLLAVIALLLRFVAMANVPLVPEEAYYWVYAQHPELSYYDHPPMVAWVIGLGTGVFGNTEFGVRIIGSLLMLGASALMYVFGRIWYGRAVGLIAAATLVVLPVYFGTGFIATMDAPLVFFWMLSLVGVSIALKEQRSWGWYLAGAAMGAAMLSKYTGVFLGLGGVLTVLGCRAYRRQLLTVHPYLAALLALAIFFPVIAWNAQHDWASFRFQFIDRFAGRSLNLEDPLQFMGMQFAVATPLLLIGIGWLAVRLLRSHRRLMTPRWWVAICFGAPLLAVMSYKSLRYDIHINWTLPAYLSLMPAVAQLLMASDRRARIQRPQCGDMRGIQWTAAVCLLFNIAAAAILLNGQPRLGTASAFGPWRELAAVVEEYEDQMESAGAHEPLIIANGKYRLASELAFYRTPLEKDVPAANFTTSQWFLNGKGLGYEYWHDSDDWLDQDCIVVDYDNGLLRFVEGHFERVEVIDDPRLSAIGYQVALCYGYRGRHTLANVQ